MRYTPYLIKNLKLITFYRVRNNLVPYTLLFGAMSLGTSSNTD